MTAINADMSDSVAWIPLATGDVAGVEPGFYTLDDEDIEVGVPHSDYVLVGGNRVLEFNGRMVERRVGGTAAAAHSSGATLTRYYPDAISGGGGGSISATDGTTTVDPATTIQFPSGTLSDLGSGVAGLSYVMQSIVVHISFDTPDLTIEETDPGLLTFPGITLATLPANSILRDLFVYWNDPWDAGLGHGVNLDIGSPDGPIQSTIGTAQVSNGGPGAVGTMADYLVDTLRDLQYRFRWRGGPVNATIDYDTGPLVSGEADIYLFVAVPAS